MVGEQGVDEEEIETLDEYAVDDEGVPPVDSPLLDSGEMEWDSISTPSPGEQATEEEEDDDDTETLDGHDVNEEDQDVPLPPPTIDEPEMDWYFREAEEDGRPAQANDGLLAPEPQPEPEVVLAQEEEVLGVEDEDEDEEEEDEEEEEEDGEEEVVEEVQRPRRGGQAIPIRAAVAFEAGPGLRRMVAIDGNDPPLAFGPAQGPQPQQQPQQGPVRNAPDEDGLMMDDMEAAVEDDMDGAMEGELIIHFGRPGLDVVTLVSHWFERPSFRSSTKCRTYDLDHGYCHRTGHLDTLYTW